MINASHARKRLWHRIKQIKLVYASADNVCKRCAHVFLDTLPLTHCISATMNPSSVQHNRTNSVKIAVEQRTRISTNRSHLHLQVRCSNTIQICVASHSYQPHTIRDFPSELRTFSHCLLNFFITSFSLSVMACHSSSVSWS